MNGLVGGMSCCGRRGMKFSELTTAKSSLGTEAVTASHSQSLFSFHYEKTFW